MKKITTLILSCSILLLTACDNNKTKATNESAKQSDSSNDDRDFTGTFTANGKKYTGNVNASSFDLTGQFEIYFQDNQSIKGPDELGLIRILFKDEASARAGGDFITAYDQQKNQAAKEVSMSVDIKYRTEEDSKGTVTVNKSGSHNDLIFDNVTLRTDSKETVIVAGKISF